MKRVNIVIGRFQPITLGHMKLVDALYKENELPVVFCLVANKKFDAKHPFSDDLISEELDIIMKNDKRVEGYIYITNADIVKCAEKLHEQNYEPMLWGCGSDRFDSYKKQADKYKEKAELLPEFDVLEIKRTDDDISATKVRNAIKEDDLETFNKMMPKGVDKLWGQFKKALSEVKESTQWVSLSDFIKENLNNHIFEGSDPFNVIIDNLEENKKMFTKIVSKKHNNDISELVNNFFNILSNYSKEDSNIITIYNQSLTKVKIPRIYRYNKEFKNEIEKLKNVSLKGNDGINFMNFYIPFGNGSVNGLNKGNEFEEIIVDKIGQFYPYIIENSQYKDKDLGKIKIDLLKDNTEHVGGKQNRLNIPVLKPEELKKDFDNASKIADIKLNTSLGPLYISAKYGPTLVQSNISIAKLIDKTKFKDPKSKSTGELDDLLNLLSIKINKFKTSFLSYNPDKEKKKVKNLYETIEITDEKALDYIHNLIKYSIGYGYTCVWDKNKTGDPDKCHYLYVDKKMNEDMLGKINRAFIKYPNGHAKRVEIEIDNDGLAYFKIVFRNKSGDVLPTFMLIEYKPEK